MKSICDLSDNVVDSIISFLAQGEIINLALTNYRFYEPCAKKLYSKICIQTYCPLRSNQHSRKVDFLEATQTTIHGFRKPTSKRNHYKLIGAKIESLEQSLLINTEHLKLVKEITIVGSFDKAVHCSIRKLLRLFEGRSLNFLLVLDDALRYELRKVFDSINTQRVVIDEMSRIGRLSGRDVYLSLKGHNHNDPPKFTKQIIGELSKVKSLILSPDRQIYQGFIDSVIGSKSSFKITTFRFSYEHGDDISRTERLVGRINQDALTNMEVIVSCNSSPCDEDCLIEFFNILSVFKNITRLSIIQGQVYDSHYANEFFDLNLINFFKGFQKLRLLSVAHSTPKNGTFKDGFEGNYLRRYRLYSRILPSVLPPSLKTLVLPNLMSSFACYEQQMNNVLYNGCRCNHCVYYLELLDELLFTHKFYDNKRDVFKDLVGNQIIHTVSDYLSQRMMQHHVLTNLRLLDYPLQNVDWNFHDNASSMPYRCLPQQVIHEGDFDEGDDIFFDCEENPALCKFNESVDFSNYGTVIGHFLDNLIEVMTELDRGDAEGLNIGDELNDGMGIIKFNKVLINGIDYNLDKELNGTSFFNKVHDS